MKTLGKHRQNDVKLAKSNYRLAFKLAKSNYHLCKS